MDQFHLQKVHGHQINDIMNMARNKYELKSCDISKCAHSSRLYRVDDKSAELKIFDKEDKESIFQVVMDIVDGIHHLISLWTNFIYKKYMVIK